MLRREAAAPQPGPLDPDVSAAIGRARGGGAPLERDVRADMERAFSGRDFSAVRVHTGAEPDRLNRALAARAFATGPDIFFRGGEYNPATSGGRGLLAHELTHVVQQSGVPVQEKLELGGEDDPQEHEAAAVAAQVMAGAAAPPIGEASELVAMAGMARREKPGAAVPAAAAVDPAAFKADPPASRMAASLDGLVFTPADAAQYVVPDDVLGPSAIVAKRLAGDDYTPALLDEVMAKVNPSWIRSAPGSGPVDSIRLRPNAVPGWLKAVDDWLKANGGAGQSLVKPEQRVLVEAGRALNPVPPPIWQALKGIMTVTVTPGGAGDSPDDRHPNFLASRQRVLLALAAQWWSQTQAYVRAFNVWEADKSPESTDAAAAALDGLLDTFDPYARILVAIHSDPALPGLPSYGLLWPAGKGKPGRLEDISDNEAVSFVMFAASQAPSFLRLARREPAARQSLLDGWAASRGQLPARQGDQATQDAPATYNAPPLDIRMDATPPLQPPMFGAPTGTKMTFYTSIRFLNMIEGLSNAFGGWDYRWDAKRIPDNDLANLSRMSIPSQDYSTTDQIGANLSRDLRNARADMAEVGTPGSINALIGAMGPPGISGQSMVAVNFVMDSIGSVVGGLISALTQRPSEFPFEFTEPGLYLIRCQAGPRLADHPNVAQFRRAPSVAWLPVYAMAPQEMAQQRLKQEVQGRAANERRYAEISELLARGTQPDEADLRSELAELRMALYGGVPEILQAQRAKLEAGKAELETQLKRIEGNASRPGDAGVLPSGLRRQISALSDQEAELDLLIGLRAKRAAPLTAATRLTAVLAKDDGTVLSLVIEAASVKDSKPPSWYVSDLTTKDSGFAAATASGKYAPGSPAQDAVMTALVELLKGNSGYGRGWLSVSFPEPASASGANPAPTTRVARIEQSSGQIAMHGLSNVATLLSIAAVVAAPFTGGASLTLMLPAGLIGAIPAAYRLVSRGEMGTLRFDLQSAMDIVDIAGAVLNLGEATAAGRAAAQAGTRAGLRYAVVEGALWITGLGANGLGIMLMGKQLLDQLEQLNGLEPPGLRMARLTEIIGNAMMTAGIQIGGALAAKATVRHVSESLGSTMEGRPTGLRPLDLPPPEAARSRRAGRIEAPQALAEALPADVRRTTPIDVDPHLAKGTVHVDYAIGDNGRVDPATIRIVAGKGSSAGDVALHAEAARTLHAYAGLLGATAGLLQRLRGMLALGGVNEHAAPEQGSAAWEAQLEIAKLDGIVRARLASVKGQVIDEVRAGELASDLRNLDEQIQAARAVLDGYAADPRGFIASDSPEQRAKRITGANSAVVAANRIGMVTIRRGRVTVSEFTPAGAGPNPAPGYHFTEDLVMRRNAKAPQGDPQLILVEHNGRRYIAPAAPAGVDRASHENGIRAQIDGYDPPPSGHHYVPNEEGWQWQRNDGYRGNAKRIVFQDGKPVRAPDGTLSFRELEGVPSFADRRQAAAESFATAQSGDPVLELAMDKAGIPETAQARGLIRKWGKTLRALGEVQAENLGEDLESAPELASAAVAGPLAGTAAAGAPSQSQYDNFRYLLRDASIAAIFGLKRQEIGAYLRGEEALAPARAPAEQLQIYKALYAALPDSGSRGELFTRYREMRNRLSGEQGGFGAFKPLDAPGRRLLETKGVGPTDIDGAVSVPKNIGVGLPTAGEYAVESKAGASFNPEQAVRYDKHLKANGNKIMLEGSAVQYEGVIYTFETVDTATTAMDYIVANGLSERLYVSYIERPSGRLMWLRRAASRRKGG